MSERPTPPENRKERESPPDYAFWALLGMLLGIAWVVST